MLTSVKEALKTILENTEDFGTESIHFLEATGRILKENIIADRDFPPFDRVSMDGIAIDFEMFEKGQKTFEIENVQAAGSPQKTLEAKENCLEAMTGAILPKNTNCVIPYEKIHIEDNKATIQEENLRFFQNIHAKGKDQKVGDVLIEENTEISAAEIGILASVGKEFVKVAKLPKIVIVSTGDELVDVNETPEVHQIRRSNVYSLYSLLEKFKIKADLKHINDNKEVLEKTVKTLFENYDVLIFSGAVSKGKFDFIPEILNTLGVQKLFHKVQQRPGKPFWFGKKENKTVFAFPGNPVSTYVNCIKYFYSWYEKSVFGQEKTLDTAILSEDFTFKPSLTYFLQVKLENKNGETFAIPEKGNGSGDLANLVSADAFIELSNEITEFKKGMVFPILKYR
ncbi:molybdopterin molybdotransferase MoeA [Aureivirga sp. CE67]|uniref:molybdopterin molybdotransferase MoeA n=1 Tax=Aureivirga sp. CE67 TaxID=1788983 RepID=UPI0018CB7F10|nr:molybdopterin molybdotransferase MoeA [Aureivirga sp. CE67]